MMKMSKIKTNAMRILDREKIAYQVSSYQATDGKIDGISVAEKIGVSPKYVYKTLIAQGADHQLYVFIIPVAAELDLKKAASAAKEKKIEMLPVKDITKYTGYIRGGCSPIGMKKHYPTFIDHHVNDLETLYVSAGKIGVQITLSPVDLITAVDAVIADLTK